MNDPVSTLERLVDLTPEPPSPDADPAEVLQAGEELVSARQSFVDWLREQLGDDPNVNPAAAPYLAALRERDARWDAALRRARHELSLRLAASSRFNRSRP